ncbi:MAG: NAD(P)/FAD-dependent oxidoreductase, partial [Gemmatimonadales bacterium]
MAEQELKDISIIGGGPTGLFAAFYAGMRGATARIIDALPALGGQLMALYPEKYIFDVAGFPKVLAKDLVRDMATQGLQFGATTHLGEVVTGLDRVENGDESHFVLQTSAGTYPTRTIVIAAGIGAFEARRLGVEGEEQYEERGLYFKVLDPKQFEGKRVLLVGGGDSAFDWAVNLQGVAKSIMLIHRRDGFRAHAATISQVQELQRCKQCEVRTFWEVKALHGNGRLEGVTIFNNKTKEEEELQVDAVIPLLGFHSDLGAIKEWGLDTEKADIKVDRVMATNVPGIYAAGDITSYPGKLKLIATGAGEACIAVNNAVHFI